MRIHSAVYAVVRCLSVCLSVTLVYCDETTEFIIKQFALDCSRGTLVYRQQTWIISLGDPLIGGIK